MAAAAVPTGDAPAEVENQKVVLNDFSAAACGKHVTVYCWSRTEPGSDRWVQAESLGAQLAARGYGMVTGGYCGSMEAVSKGSREAPMAAGVAKSAPKAIPDGHPLTDLASVDDAHVTVRGILVPGQFPDRCLVGNKFLTDSVDTPTLPKRLDVLSALTRYYIALPGTLGTLTEICMIWSLSVLHKAGAPRPVILCFREPWEKALAPMAPVLGIPDEHMAALQFVDSVEECVAIIEADYAAHAVEKQA
jgi:predicted Rossmann-fold nucleotide-binding protein